MAAVEFPKAGVMRGGQVHPRPQLLCRQVENRDALLPTPTRSFGVNARGWGLSKTGRRRYSEQTQQNAWRFGARPSIELLEWMMGFPSGWTDVERSEEKEVIKLTAAQDLERLETEINTEAFEAFYKIGQKLLQIKTQRLYESAGFKSWSAYCASGRIEIVKKQADNLIRASELRPKLGTIGSHNWTERQMRELCKCETDNDAKRVAKKAVAQAAKTGERVTAKLIAEIRDGADETRRADQRRDERLQSASLQNHLVKLSDTLTDYRCSLEQVESSQWGDVEIGVLSRLQRELTGLLALTKQN
jgi:hypothetical protein